MIKTPNSNRIHIGIYGKRNVGKSSLLNAITGQNVAVVSSVRGTTTDPVRKAMEFIPLGPVLFIDTAGIDDEGELGEKRVEKSMQTMLQTDFAIYVMDANDLDEGIYNITKKSFKRFNIPHMIVINKIDTISKERKLEIEKTYCSAKLVTTYDNDSILRLKDELILEIKRFSEEEHTMIGDVIPYNGKIVMVVPIDSEAPKGRIILPQVQLIRDCLDHGIKSYVTRDVELKDALLELENVDLVVTDSQAFNEVDKMVPLNIKLTSFSILLSRVKGDLREFINGVQTLDKLEDGANILVAESCTHNSTCNDIGRVKIPKGIKKFTNKSLNFDICAGKDFPEDLSKYSLIIHCASCILNRKSMQTRMQLCKEFNVPITNYGILLAYINGILPRTIEIFRDKI